MYRELSRALLNFAKPNYAVRTACDVGCGTGVSTRALLSCVRPDGIVYGFDQSDAMLAIAARDQELKKIKFINSPPGAHIKFDFLFSNAAFWQLTSSLQATWCNSNLSSKGLLAFNCPVELCDDDRFRHLLNLSDFRSNICPDAVDMKHSIMTYRGSAEEAFAFLEIPIFKDNASKQAFQGCSTFSADWLLTSVRRS